MQGLEDGCLYFEVVAGVVEVPYRLNDPRALAQQVEGVSVGEDVHVAAAEPCFHVSQPMPLLRRWPQRLGHHSPSGDLQGRLVRAGAEHRAADLDQVPEVYSAAEQLVGLRADGIAPEIDLHAPGGILKLCEARAAHRAQQQHAASQGQLLVRRLLLSQDRQCLLQRVGPAGARRKRRGAGIVQPLELRAARLDEGIVVAR